MQSADLTLNERACRMYRQLLILQQVFGQRTEDDATGAVTLRVAVKEMLDELTEHAGVLMSAPFPIGEWRAGDGPDDERWRALTEIERRELLALIAEYEQLVAWCQGASAGDLREPDALRGGSNIAVIGGSDQLAATEYLTGCRAQLARFRKELAFLDRRRSR